MTFIDDQRLTDDFQPPSYISKPTIPKLLLELDYRGTVDTSIQFSRTVSNIIKHTILFMLSYLTCPFWEVKEY